MKLITLYIPEPYLKSLDRLVDENYYSSRAEAIRVAIRDLLSVEIWPRLNPDEYNSDEYKINEKIKKKVEAEMLREEKCREVIERKRRFKEIGFINLC